MTDSTLINAEARGYRKEFDARIDLSDLTDESLKKLLSYLDDFVDTTDNTIWLARIVSFIRGETK